MGSGSFRVCSGTATSGPYGGIWLHTAHRLGSAQTLVYGYLEALITIALAVRFLGEGFDALQALGAAILLVGVGLARRG